MQLYTNVTSRRSGDGRGSQRNIGAVQGLQHRWPNFRLPDQLWNNFRHLRLAKARRTLAEKRGRAVTIAEPMGQGWLQLSEFGLAFGLSALIRFGRDVHHKSADLKSADLPTYALVGLACALILLASKCGFTNVLESDRLVLDPAGIAVQIAIATTAGYFIVVVILPAVERRLPKPRWAPVSIHVAYCGGRDVLTQILTACPQHDFAVTRLLVKGEDGEPCVGTRPGSQQAKSHGRQWDEESPGFQDDSSAAAGRFDGALGAGSVVKLLIEVHGTKSIPKLAARIADLPGVVSVQAGDAASD
jgi:putative Mg2+ transporter-C (MgtC) family protein